jgi:hypothetical protein
MSRKEETLLPKAAMGYLVSMLKTRDLQPGLEGEALTQLLKSLKAGFVLYLKDGLKISRDKAYKTAEEALTFTLHQPSGVVTNVAGLVIIPQEEWASRLQAAAAEAIQFDFEKHTVGEWQKLLTQQV